MASAQGAAAAIEKAAEALPNVLVRVRATLGQAQRTLADFDADSNFGRDTAAALHPTMQERSRDDEEITNNSMKHRITTYGQICG